MSVICLNTKLIPINFNPKSFFPFIIQRNMNISSEIISLPLDFKSHPFFFQTAIGNWLLAYVSTENNQLNFMMSDQSLNQQKTPANWKSRPEINKDTPDSYSKIKNITSLSMVYDNKGDLILVYSQLTAENLHALFISSSSNYGKQWEISLKISEEWTSWKTDHRPIILQVGFNVGKIICPIEDLQSGRVFMLISEDNAKSWHSSLFLEPTDSDKLEFHQNKTFNPSIIEDNIGNIHCFCHSSDSLNLYHAISSDSGNTWGEIYPITGLPIDLKCDYDVIYFNNQLSTNVGQKEVVLILGMQQIAEQYRLTVWASYDRGENFQEFWYDDRFSENSVEICRFFTDFEDQIHILVETESHSLKHYWGSFNSFKLD
jgi:hypothetical protein